MTSTSFYDKRAERQVAAAIALEHQAEAEARRTETDLRRLDVAERQAKLAEQQAARVAKRARQARAERVQLRADRWAAIRAAVNAVRVQLASVVPMLVGAIAMGAPVLIGWNGQLQTARAVLHLGLLAWVFPVALEGGAWWLAYLTSRAIHRQLPTGRLRAWTWVLALIAAGMNFWHGSQAYGPLGGAGLGLASLLGIGLWEITAWHHRQHAAGRTGSEVRTAWMRRLRFPRLTWAAASIAIALGSVGDRNEAWRAAWINRYGFGPEASRRDRRLGRLIIKHESKADREAAQRGDLVIINGVILRCLPTLIASTNDSSSESPETAIEQGKLSRLAAALLPRVKAAIAAGELPERPAANAIRTRFGGGMETAQEVRDALRSIRPVNDEEVA
ncbi:MAG TPA: DUF2637 domain-containing protein [Pseudonocardiaceae bacterium]|jgi:hypothetical protein|nr:DUF2637 domain-containing protein [Pseudonocardiaceae bacterium]